MLPTFQKSTDGLKPVTGIFTDQSITLNITWITRAGSTFFLQDLSGGVRHTYLRTLSVRGQLGCELKGYLDSPHTNAVISAPVTVMGWAIASCSSISVEVLIDGNHVGNAELGFRRPDACLYYSDYNNCFYSGFQYQLDPQTLAPGDHTLQLRVRGGGLSLEIPTQPLPFRVVR